jgi:hypothetical protein
MWPLGVLVTVLVAVAISYRLSLLKPSPQITAIWDLSRSVSTYTSISGTLAGFSVTSAVFLANMRVARDAQEFEGVLAMFLFAFIAFIGAALQFSSTPNAPINDPRQSQVQRYSYVFANLGFYQGLAQSLLGLRLLLLGIGFNDLADIFIGVLLFITIAESFRIARMNLHLTSHSPLACLAIPFIAVACASGYYGLSTRVDGLWPETDAPLKMAVVVFVSTATGYTLQNTMLMISGRMASSDFLCAFAEKIVLLYSQAAATCIFLLWLAMAGA